MNFDPIEASGKTAVHRLKPSVPARTLEEILFPGETVFDLGCGYGEDIKYFNDLGYTCDGYDPVHKPEKKMSEHALEDYDWVLCSYVLNTLPPIERRQVIKTIYDFLPLWGATLIAVRSAVDVEYSKENGSNWEKYCDGYLTSKGTFQKGFTDVELCTVLHETGFVATERISSNPVIVVARKWNTYC